VSGAKASRVGIALLRLLQARPFIVFVLKKTGRGGTFSRLNPSAGRDGWNFRQARRADGRHDTGASEQQVPLRLRRFGMTSTLNLS
jgi:hypothetical protein